MRKETLNASRVAQLLGDFFSGPLLLPREVEVRYKNSKPIEITGVIEINETHPFIEMNGGKLPEELIISAAKQFSMLLKKLSDPDSIQNLFFCHYIKKKDSAPCFENFFAVKVANYQLCDTFKVNVTGNISYEAELSLSFSKCP